MRRKFLIPLLLFITASLSCRNAYYRAKTVYQVASVNNNINKKLYGKVILYAIFVDSREPKPWTTYDITSTLDSVRTATSWIMQKAKENNMALDIQVDYHRSKENIIPIPGGLNGGSLSETLFKPNLKEGMEALDMWANGVAKKAGESFGPDTSRFVHTKNLITDRERLIARLRDKYKTDNVALVYFINNYHYDEISLALHSGSDVSAEYAIISFKHPAIIAHEFLHLFGALDLYMSPFDRKRRALKNKNQIMEAYPNEVMAFYYRPVHALDISPLTRYLLGWSPVLEDKDKDLILGKKLKVYKY